MTSIYAMSDMHGQFKPFEEALSLVDFSNGNMLVLCGDYIDHKYMNDEIYCDIHDLQERYPGQVIALKGNIDDIYLNSPSVFAFIPDEAERREMKRWLRKLPDFYETDTQILVHAGVDEEAGDLWKLGTDEHFFREKYPPSRGRFVKDVIAGHVGTHSLPLANDPDFHDVYWDGASHYFLDGTTERSSFVPVLEYEVESGRYFHFPLAVEADGSERRLRVPVVKEDCQ